ncbi:MAG TPA: thioredoxin domain-containing protein [Candidatus Limnocylindrales bacterium]|nr:thioredoxin domain-containing protein [Candidatus Limnocylindrales bacterium]
MSAKSNRLAAETSPYLLQHAHNPVDWYPWGPEALARAVFADRPIFLSIGYAACHWCHVMERESFEDEETAAVLNAGFVSIKVDREERPDLDAVYMRALQSMTGGGGWPMSLFLMPDGRPFYGGTYYPRDPRYGMPSFRQILAAVERSWGERRAGLEAAADRLMAELRLRATGPAEESETGSEQVRPTPPDRLAGVAAETVLSSGLRSNDGQGGVVATAVERLVDEFDFAHGGWAGPPRFPQPAVIDLLLRWARVDPEDQVLRTSIRALDVMAHGGIHDQVGGGFHRYATDTDWLVPHFEKMLYDNAQLARVYLHAYQLTGEQRFRNVAETTLDYMVRELRTRDGLFAASQDADTDGIEGGTYVWTLDEVAAVLGGTVAKPGPGPQAGDPGLPTLFASAYGVTADGNWEGRTILSRVMSDEQVAAMYGLAPQTVTSRLELACRLLLERRGSRSQPALDDKAVAAWNGLALAAFAEAIPVLDRPDDLAVAERLAEAALRLLRGPGGRLARSFRSGRTTGIAGLDDYACLADGLVSLYEATFDERWLVAAFELIGVVERQFADAAGGWFDTATDAEPLIVRPKEIQDGATPAGGATAAAVVLRLAELTGAAHLRDTAERAIGQIERRAVRYPRAFPAWLGALDFASARVAQVAIVGEPEAADARALVEVARRGFQPYRVLALGDPESSTLDLLHGRFAMSGRATAFVCRGFACRRPVTEPEELADELA